MDRAQVRGTGVPRGLPPIVCLCPLHFGSNRKLARDPGRRCPQGRQPRSCHRVGGWAAGGRHSGWHGRTAPPMGRPAGADSEIPDAPAAASGRKLPIPAKSRIRYSRFPDHRIPGQIGNRPRGPESRKFSRSRPNRESNPGKSQFFAAARTVIAHCGTASGRPRLVQF
jgi:hypothetical protein